MGSGRRNVAVNIYLEINPYTRTKNTRIILKKLFVQMTWEENWQICCSIGMKPIILETLAEQMCLENMTAGWPHDFIYRVKFT
jgi:predicted  nucleic acid-binding Zn ribbon protein